MTSSNTWNEIDIRTGLLIDTNLLVLFIVGSVSRKRIANFKRTSQYDESDYDLLVRVLSQFETLYTLAHVMTEVSNLTDLNGRELLQARSLLKETLAVLHEPALASAKAAESPHYGRLGLADAAISELANEYKCAVLTDDLDLYLALSRAGVQVLNFAHLRSASWHL